MKQISKTVRFKFIIFSIASIFVASLVVPVLRVAAQDPVQITDQSWTSDFRDRLTFNLSAQASSEIVEVDHFYRVKGQLATARNEAEFVPGSSVEAQYAIDQADTTDPSYTYFPPGTELEYWWKITDTDGNELKTEKETVTYLDNRYNWQTLENDRVTLYWYDGGDDFGQALFDRADEALDTLETDIGIALKEPIKIFIYSGHQDLLNALSVTAQEWTGGVAYTEFGVVVIGIHPGQLDWGLNAMTHEMTHLVIHQATDNPFTGLPRWLDEGIAVYNENRDELDDDFKPLFERAVANDDLMTLRTLSSPFPADPVEANLAYGQSGAVVKFIVDTYGSEAMARLLEIFSEGAIADEALEEALGINTDALDNEFRVSLGLEPLPGLEADPPVESQVEAEEATSAEQTEANEQVVDAQTEDVAQPAPVPTEKSETDLETGSSASAETTQPETGSSPLSALPCVGGLIFLLIAGWMAFRPFG